MSDEQALHDVSNELTAALAWLERAAVLAAGQEELARALEASAARVRAAIATARAELGAGEGRRSPRRLRALVVEVATDLAAEAERRGVRIDVALPEGEVQGPAVDPRAARTVLANLVLNALAFAPAGSSVRVRFVQSGEAAEVHVEDDGPGVPAEVGDRVFTGTSLRPGGTGHGLVHARRAAVSVGGSLSLVDAARGAHFVFRVAPRPRPLAGRRGLVVEDDADLRLLLEAALGSAGASVDATPDPRHFHEALLPGARFDFVLVDASPFGPALREALARLASLEPRPRVVVMSGKADPDIDGVGWVEFLRKPFELRELIPLLA